ncbi:hypothetical protein EG328_009007 [Venturia inaequalis]|uniref:Uncharacterized protein n=1 Tax=Venturia inaequalis TaxID=5025 RepID=A0A8H3U9G5_VENIN|nr:hypothetical protein EG328_009007 [Venturia inaequalis]
MVLFFTAALPIILSLLATQSMAQSCRYGIVNSKSQSFTREAFCPLSRRDNVYYCGSSGASITIRGTQVIAHAGSGDASMMVTCDHSELLYGCDAV